MQDYNIIIIANSAGNIWYMIPSVKKGHATYAQNIKLWGKNLAWFIYNIATQTVGFKTRQLCSWNLYNDSSSRWNQNALYMKLHAAPSVNTQGSMQSFRVLNKSVHPIIVLLYV